MTEARGAVRRRHVLYVPGYDPRGPRTYFLMFKRELARWAERNGVQAELTRVKGAETPGLSTWRLTSNGPGGGVETTLDFLAWDDLAEREFRVSYGQRLAAALEVFGYSVRSGLLWDMASWNWKFGLFAFYPWAMALGYVLIAAGWTALCFVSASHVGSVWAAAPLAAVASVAGLWGEWRLIRRWEPKLYVFYLLNDWIWTARYRRGRDAASDARFEAFARQLAQVADAGTADELLLVGHSSGSFVAAVVAARALELSPILGRDQPLGLLTIGANTPVACAGSGRSPGREAIAKLLAEPRVRWIEYFTPNDVMSYPRLDYKRCYRVDLGGRQQINPIHRSARMAEIFTHETWRRLDWRFFEKHFQFLRANERPGEYDFYRFLAGPERFGSTIER